MAKKQSRRSISVSRATYERLKSFCETNQISMSQFVEHRVGDYLGRSIKRDDRAPSEMRIPSAQHAGASRPTMSAGTPRPATVAPARAPAPRPPSVAAAPAPVVQPVPVAAAATPVAQQAPVPSASAPPARPAAAPAPAPIRRATPAPAPAPAKRTADQIFTF